MGVPNVGITKVDGQTGVVRPSVEGVLAIIGPAQSGTVNQPTNVMREQTARATFGIGQLADAAAYVLPQSKKPCLLVRAVASTAGAAGAVTHVGAGTSVATVTGTPLDDFDALITFLNGGTIGVTGITYTYSLDGGVTQSAVQALGVATTIVIPNTGITFNMAAGTILTGQTEESITTGPVVTNADLTAALDSLRTTSQPFECVLIIGIADATTVSAGAAWLAVMAARGLYKTMVMTCRRRGAAESEAAYATAMATIFAASASTDIVVCADVGDLPAPATAPIGNILQPRQTGIGVAGRGMAIGLGVDAAWVALGNIPGFRLVDARNNPKYHDENMNPGLDVLRLTSFRTIDGYQGTYVNNANLLSVAGSDYVFWQHARTMNKGCGLVFQVLSKQLSRGVNKSTFVGPAGERYIAEEDALHLESLANDILSEQIVRPGLVSDMRFTLSRTDNISSNAGATLTGSLASVALAYVKTFNITAGFVKAIVQPTAGT